METPKLENKTKNFYPRTKEVELVYIGEGRVWNDIPVRDLTPREVMFYGGKFFLLRTGLYAEPGTIKLDG